MRILALDTSTAVQSVALVTGETQAIERNLPAGRGHTTSLLSSIDSVLREAGATPFDLDLVAIGIGPGSFTGLRIGMAAVKGLCLATGCPVVAVSSLATLAFGVVETRERPVATVIDARKNQLYAAVWQVEGGSIPVCRLQPGAFNPAELAAVLRRLSQPLLGVGNGLAALAPIIEEPGQGLPIEILDERYWWPRATVLAELGRRLVLQEGPTPLGTLEPEYIRLSDAELNWNKRQVKRAKP
ncbi:MAG: tRNA (adenosine(37)-N6)-threonylcarbamoyltransferase complex dimerization subunit type 1 TsaB [Bradymonadales bacterium]|nr:tRNA (adenosine(37)-N6)-threonylcarbamoyltransferase complex dimerization subunit type 1 TsaB [Bradymonadales bacterium]